MTPLTSWAIIVTALALCIGGPALMARTAHATLISTRDAADSLGVTPATINRWVARGTMTPTHKGLGPRGAHLFTRAEIARIAQLRDQQGFDR